MLSSGVGFALLTFAENLYLTTATLVITETASALFLIGSKAILSENLPIGQRAKAFSLRYTLTNIGYATGPMLGVVIAGVYPAAPFLIAGAIAFFSIFLMTGIPKDSEQAPPIGQPQSFLKTLVTLKNDRTLIMFTCGCLLSTVVHGRFTLYLSQYLLVTHDAKDALDIMAALLACNAISVILLQYQIGRFLTREKLRFWIAAGTSLFIVGLIGFNLAPGDVYLYPRGNDHLSGRIPLRRYPGSGRTAWQLLRRTKSGGTRRRAEPGDLWLSVDAHSGADHVLCLERAHGDGRSAVFHEWPSRRFTSELMN
jgi:MFS family permease